MAKQQDCDCTSASVLLIEIAKFNGQKMEILEEDAMKELIKLLDKEKEK